MFAVVTVVRASTAPKLLIAKALVTAQSRRTRVVSVAVRLLTRSIAILIPALEHWTAMASVMARPLPTGVECAMVTLHHAPWTRFVQVEPSIATVNATVHTRKTHAAFAEGQRAPTLAAALNAARFLCWRTTIRLAIP